MSIESAERRSQLVAGTAYLSVLGVLVGALLAVGAGIFEKTFPVTTEVPTVGGGLPVGADVKLRGLRVGEVSEVEVGPDGARISMELDPEFANDVPASVQSRVLTANVFGVPFVELVPSGPETPSVARNAEIPADTSRESIELATLYETAYDVLVAIEPAKLNSALTAIASTVQGNGERIGALIQQSSAYLSQLTPHRRQFERNVDLLARILTRADASDEVLLDAVDNTAHVARTLVANREEFANLLAVGTRSADSMSGILAELEPQLIAVARTSAPVFATLAAHQDSPLASLLALGRVASGILSIRNPAGGISVRVLIEGVPFRAYTTADCPRYGSLAGPNCASARVTSRAYAGTSGPVGSTEELDTLSSLAGGSARSAGLIGLVAGPALRGEVVATR